MSTGPSQKNKYEFIKSCVNLLKAAKKETRTVNGVIFPEYALDYEVFDVLCKKMKAEEDKLEFLIGGSSVNCRKEKGNHVVTRIWYPGGSGSDRFLTLSRRKHHRWRMDRTQLSTYGLTSTLNPAIENWWENIPLGKREIHFARFRESSVFSVLICEELARSDPCHSILRAVAPNLIFALLLDGPQIRQRWPAQYASNLADDPGSAVLTFTSYGLIDRTIRQGFKNPSRAIALWKDDAGHLVEIDMPPGDGPRGVLLSLWSESVKDATITGKWSNARAWRYASHVPIHAKGREGR